MAVAAKCAISKDGSGLANGSGFGCLGKSLPLRAVGFFASEGQWRTWYCPTSRQTIVCDRVGCEAFYHDLLTGTPSSERTASSETANVRAPVALAEAYLSFTNLGRFAMPRRAMETRLYAAAEVLWH